MKGYLFFLGYPKKEKYINYYVLNADIIASVFFLVTRYEEYVNRDCRDLHGRFIGKQSLPYRLGFLDDPIVEMYGEYIKQLLKDLGYSIRDKQGEFISVNMTHDIDIPWSDFGSRLDIRIRYFIREITAFLFGKNKKSIKII